MYSLSLCFSLILISLGCFVTLSHGSKPTKILFGISGSLKVIFLLTEIIGIDKMLNMEI
jgi:hypothetical protein